jgi:phospholipase D1/2
VLRSAADWSHGILKEDSIQRELANSWRIREEVEADLLEAYIGMIREANHCVYIENQFCKFADSQICANQLTKQCKFRC